MADKSYKNNQEELEHAITQGVSSDNVNLRTVTFWIILGIFIVTIMVYGIYNMYTYNQFLASEKAAVTAEFHELNHQRNLDYQKLNSVELLDEEERRYRIPIDSAMTLIIMDQNGTPL